MVTKPFSDGSAFEALAGYSRAVRRGAHIAVSGTTANDGHGGVLHPGDAGAQTAAALRHGIAAIEALGGSIADVVRTRVFLAPDVDWAAAAASHALVFGDIRPANTTLHIHSLIGDDFLVEIEIDAIVDPS